MSHSYHPDPEFVSNLEWQVRTALRREQRFAEPVPSKSGGRVKIATMILVSALFGAGGVVVKDQVQDARRQEILLAEVAADQRMAAMELDFLRSRLEEAERRAEVGQIPQENVRSARLRVQEAEARLTRLSLDEEEIRLTGRSPDEALAAPLVEGRDFVTERLALDAWVVDRQREAAREDLDRLSNLSRLGTADEADLARARSQEERLDRTLQELSERMALREQVLAGEVSGDEAEALMEVREIRLQLAVLAPLREDAMARLARAEEMVANGVAPESHLQEVRLQVMELETQFELLTRKLEILGEGQDQGRAP
jgi:hypothetical protein